MRYVVSYNDIDAFILADSALTSNERVAWLHFSDVIHPTTSKKLTEDILKNTVDYSSLKFKLLDSMGYVVKFLPHDILQRQELYGKRGNIF